MTKPTVAVIGTGGTICSIGTGAFDILDYGANNTILHADELVARFPELDQVANVIPVRFRNVPSPNISFPDWRELLLVIDKTVAEHPGLDGIVVLHGTASLEETAYFLNLTAKVSIPVVVVGSQRPPSALSSDAGMNLANAIRTAGSPQARGMGVLVLLNDEIHAARDVTKTSTFRLQTFRTADFGVLGHADGDAVVFYRKPIRKMAPDSEFDPRGLEALPRVDIVLSYAGSDGTASRAFVAAGAKGIISAGFAPGFAGEGEAAVLRKAAADGVVVVQSTRAGSGRTFKGTKLRESGFIVADNLTPQKARILLSLALTVTSDVAEIERMFLTY
jgi:L-asparaginase